MVFLLHLSNLCVKKVLNNKMKRQKGSGVRRPFINKRNRLMLGSGKRKIKGKRRLKRKQRGGFFGPIASSVLTSLVPEAINLVKKII